MHFTHIFSRNQRIEYPYKPSARFSNTNGAFGLSSDSDATVEGVLGLLPKQPTKINLSGLTLVKFGATCFAAQLLVAPTLPNAEHSLLVAWPF